MIVSGKYVLTSDGLKENYSLIIEDGTIKEILPTNQLKNVEGVEVIEVPNGIVTPGFINAHTHMYGTVAHGIHTEKVIKDFTDFLEIFWWPMVEDQIDHELIKATTAWACVESIDSGVTTIVDTLEAPNSLMGCLNTEKEVIENFGLRAYLSFEASQRKDEDNSIKGLNENYTFTKENKDNELIKGFMSIHTLFTCDKEYILKAKKMADEAGSFFHMHLSESIYEPTWSLEKYGKRPVEIYDKLGVLDNNILASQVVQMSEEEKEILLKKNVNMIHMPLSNCEVGGGIAPYPDFIAKKGNVGLGSDGYINNFFEIMRGAFLIHKAFRQDPQVMKGKEVFDMATVLGAKSIGRNDLGKIEVGAKADIITIELDTPTPINEHNLYDQLILFRNPQNVSNVLVNGHILKKDGKLINIDVEKIKNDLRIVTQKLWDKQ
ncbi:MAG: amidohydrolase [Fusobacteria bacterium]|nr:MAG: amidohydrolase [Fusobacteriota bacterium]KAF0230089.1 MAG: hypothetical protein FD182_479 [Fusobacteriota bacterium]